MVKQCHERHAKECEVILLVLPRFGVLCGHTCHSFRHGSKRSTDIQTNTLRQENECSFARYCVQHLFYSSGFLSHRPGKSESGQHCRGRAYLQHFQIFRFLASKIHNRSVSYLSQTTISKTHRWRLFIVVHRLHA